MNIIDRFSEHLKDALSKAMVLATEMNHKEVAPIHLFFALSNLPGSIATEIIDKFNTNPKIIEQLLINLKSAKISGSKKLNRELELTPYSSDAKKIIEKAILIAHTFKHNYVGSEHLLSALLNISNNLIQELIKLNNINKDEMLRHVQTILENSTQFPLVAQAGKALDKMQPNLPDDLISPMMPNRMPNPNNSSALNLFATNLTSEESQKNIDPVIGREIEIERLIQILSRRNKNNPILLGDPGVGKTAIVEGLAKKIYEGEVPEILLNKKIFALDMGILIAGTTFRGEFEGRLQQIIEEISSDPNIILFIDEVHNIVGAGSNQGTMDASNILKPALARGHIRCIGATTPAEFKKYIENDAALERRFQSIIVKQSSVTDTVHILMGLRKNYETYHNVSITDDAIISAAHLSDRYITGKFLPDKAIDLIDETSASKKLHVKASKKQIQLWNMQKKLELALQHKEKSALNDNFEDAVKYKKEEEDIKKQISQITQQIAKQKKKPVGIIDKKDIVEQLSKIIGTPVDKLLINNKQKFDTVLKILKQNIIGQDKNLANIVQIIQQAQLQLSNPNKPMASFMFVGESGVGKTETAKHLAELLYPGGDSLIRLDMSEYNESFGVSKLLGSPAGYVGYKESNPFTDKIKLNPYCVVLFDEIDKAHKDVTKLLLQILENGEIVDSTGKKISLKHAIIIMTTTVGAQDANKEEIGFNKTKESLKIKNKLAEEKLKEYFTIELINRIDKVCLFNNLDKNDLVKIAKLEIHELNKQLKNYKTKLNADVNTLISITNSLSTDQLNARYIRNNLRKELEKLISEQIIQDTIKQQFKIQMVNKQIAIK